MDQERDVKHDEKMMRVPKQLEVGPTRQMSLPQSRAAMHIPHLLDGRGYDEDEADGDQHAGESSDRREGHVLGALHMHESVCLPSSHAIKPFQPALWGRCRWLRTDARR